jgi:LuxR family maltose regulon positive regulatory protein
MTSYVMPALPMVGATGTAEINSNRLEPALYSLAKRQRATPMTAIPQAPNNPLDAGQAALGRAAWREARTWFEAALAAAETAEALEGLGMACWWLSDASTAFGARERAYQLYRHRRDNRGAARVATCLAMDHCTFRGEAVLAGGWIRRAEHLLAGEMCRELGGLLVVRAHMALMYDHDPASAQRLAAEAGSLGRTLGDIDLEMLAMAYEGLALVSLGRVGEGMRCLDEATIAAAAGEMNDVDATCTACCCMIYACEKTRDFERAAQWCAQLEDRSRRSSYQVMFVVCRVHYAGLLIWRGAWAEAEAELANAMGEMERTHRAQAAGALVMLAALRCRQGRLDEAAALFDRAEAHPYRMMAHNSCLLGRAALALELGEAETAIDLAGRFLRAVPIEDRLERAAGLELLVRAHCSLGNIGEAEESLRELRLAAATVSTAPMRAAVRFADGLVAAPHEPATAKRCFEDAIEGWSGSGAPFEAADARIELGRVLFRLGRRAAAIEQANAAGEALCAIGASRAAGRAQELARELDGGDGPPCDGDGAGPLSRRESEILGLMAQGLTNRQIARQLCRSEHTVHRHVANILTKLDRPSRAAAVSYAAKHGLV